MTKKSACETADLSLPLLEIATPFCAPLVSARNDYSYNRKLDEYTTADLTKSAESESTIN